MKLYFSPGACSLSPHIIACEGGIPIELVKVDLNSKHTENDQDFLVLNPNGYVPVLILDDGGKLTEGPAIVQYLADLVPNTNLIPPAGTFARYQLLQWLNFISTEIHKSFSPLFKSSAPEATKQFATETLMTRLETVATHLSTHPYLLGENFSVADAYLFVTLNWGEHVNIDISKWPVLSGYRNKIAQRPAVQKAMKEEGLIA